MYLFVGLIWVLAGLRLFTEIGEDCDEDGDDFKPKILKEEEISVFENGKNYSSMTNSDNSSATTGSSEKE